MTTRTQDDLKRALGSVCQRVMLGSSRGLRLDATVMTDRTVARCWSGNDGRCFLWAVDVGDLLGSDTGEYQLGLNGNRHWRPGEKAFPFIPPVRQRAFLEDELAAWKGGSVTIPPKFDFAT